MKKIFFAIISIALISLSSCTDEAGEGTLNLSYAATVNDENMELNKIYEMDGDSVYFTLVQFYVSDMMVSDKDGNETMDIKDVAFVDFAEPTSLTYNYNMEATAYKNLSYTVGLSDERAATDPSTYASDHPLSLNKSMYWLMSNAYIYFKIEGFRVKNGVDEPIVYHVGMNGFAQTNQDLNAFSINDGNTTTKITTLNMNDLFANIDFDTEPETHTMNNMPLANKMMNNFANALSVK